MVQKSMPYVNKSGYSMFWNSMWDTKNSYSKFLQNDFFIKSFINFFLSDFFQNQFILKLNNTNLTNFVNFNYKFHHFNNSKKLMSLYLIENFNINIYFSKIWLFKYQNWIIIYFYIYSKSNSYIFKKNTRINKNNNYLYNYINNYYISSLSLNINKNYYDSFFFLKNNF